MVPSGRIAVDVAAPESTLINEATTVPRGFISRVLQLGVCAGNVQCQTQYPGVSGQQPAGCREIHRTLAVLQRGGRA